MRLTLAPSTRLLLAITFSTLGSHGLQAASSATPTLPGIDAAIQASIRENEVTGAVTVVVDRQGLRHLQATGLADVAAQRAMRPDTVFWIASMSKPITAVAVLMLQDEGKLRVDDPVERYLPAFAALKTADGQKAHLTLKHLLTHTSGLSEASATAARAAHNLSDLIPAYLAAPLRFAPGSQWAYCQSGINTAARVVEVVSGLRFDVFLQQRLFTPLGMTHTTFYPSRLPASVERVTAYRRDPGTGLLMAAPPRNDYGPDELPPLGNGGLYSTGPDYARFCQMLLNGGQLEGHRYLSDSACQRLTTVQTGDLPTGFFQSEAFGNHGKNYGWGIGTCILRTPHAGVASMLSPGTYGHGGAWGTQAWIDPVRGVAYVLMVQRTDFPNSDASRVRQHFQQAAVDALARQ